MLTYKHCVGFLCLKNFYDCGLSANNVRRLESQKHFKYWDDVSVSLEKSVELFFP